MRILKTQLFIKYELLNVACAALWAASQLSSLPAFAETSDDDCSTSATLTNGEVTCSGTKNLVKAAQITNQVGQTAAAGVVNAMGAAAQTKAQQSGNFSEMQKAAADIADNGANAQLVQGSVNAALGTWQLIQAQKLSKAAKQIKKNTDSANLNLKSSGIEGNVGDGQTSGDAGYTHGANNAYAKNALTHYKLNNNYTISEKDQSTLSACQTATPADQKTMNCDAKVSAIIKRKENAMKSQIEGKGMQAAGEVRGVSNEALAAGGASLITGLGQIAAGVINKKAAENLRAAADVKLNTGSGTTFVPTGGFGKYDMDTQTASQNSVISGDGATPTQQAGESEKDKEEQVNTDFDLGPGGAGPKDGSNLVGGGPPAGGFNVGQEGGVVGGGGGGGLGGGHTGAATPEGEPGTQPTMADGRKKNSDSYAQTGAFFTANGGGAKGGDNGAGAGTPSLSDLLAQFMPKKEDEGSKNGILDFGGGPGRAPASEAPYSFLDKRTNLFDNIHRAYQDANKRGAL